MVVGHSMGATVAIEMAASGAFSGPIVLLSPALSREDEPGFLWGLDRIGRVPGIGALAWGAMTRMIPTGMKRMIPAEHRQAWMAELRKNDGRSFSAAVHAHGEYLRAETSLVRRLCESGVKRTSCLHSRQRRVAAPQSGPRLAFPVAVGREPNRPGFM
jgi:pimeloyl-ACP methyl ester carboxylesterase